MKKRYVVVLVALIIFLTIGWNAVRIHAVKPSSNEIARLYISSGEMMWSRAFLVHQNGLVEGIESRSGETKYAKTEIDSDEFEAILKQSASFYRFASRSPEGKAEPDFGVCDSANPHNWWLYSEWDFNDGKKRSIAFKGQCSIGFPLGIPSMISGILGAIGLHGEFGQPGLEIAHGNLFSNVDAKIPDSAWGPLPEGQDFRED